MRREYWNCDEEINRKRVEPKDEFRGEIARNYIYMDFVYPGKGINSNQNREMFEEWNRSPLDTWECERSKRIERIQVNRNVVDLKRCK